MLAAAFAFGLACCSLPAQTYNPEAVAEAQRGVGFSQQAQYRDAIKAYQRAIGLDPRLPGIYLNLGLAWFKMGVFKEAAAAFEKQNQIASSDQNSTLLAMSYFGLARYKEASARLKPLADAQPQNGELSYLLAKCYFWSGQTDEAMNIFRQLLERDPDSAPVHMLLGEAYDARYMPDDAIKEFEAAAQAGPTQPDVHFGLGYLYWKQKRFDDAERQFREELKNDAKHPQAEAYMGDVMMKLGRKREATELLKHAEQLQNDLHIVHEDLGVLYADDKRSVLAMAEFREAIRTDPGNFDAHYRLARLYRELGRKEEADREFAIVQKLHEKKTEEPLMNISGPR